MDEFMINHIEGFSIAITAIIILPIMYFLLYHLLPKIKPKDPKSNKRAVVAMALYIAGLNLFDDNVADFLIRVFSS